MKAGTNILEGRTDPGTGKETFGKMPGNISPTVASGEYRLGINAGSSFNGKYILQGTP